MKTFSILPEKNLSIYLHKMTTIFPHFLCHQTSSLCVYWRETFCGNHSTRGWLFTIISHFSSCYGRWCFTSQPLIQCNFPFENEQKLINERDKFLHERVDASHNEKERAQKVVNILKKSNISFLKRKVWSLLWGEITAEIK
jgi:hypothetical protein